MYHVTRLIKRFLQNLNTFSPVILRSKISGCSFNFVTLTLGQTATPLTRSCLSNLMRSLGTATEKKDEIKMKFDKIGFSISDAVEEVLREWRSRESDKATLGLFVLHLRDCSLASHADELVKKYMTNNPGVGSFEMPVSENIFQRNIPNLRAINGTYQHDMTCNKKKHRFLHHHLLLIYCPCKQSEKSKKKSSYFNTHSCCCVSFGIRFIFRNSSIKKCFWAKYSKIKSRKSNHAQTFTGKLRKHVNFNFISYFIKRLPRLSYCVS